MPFRRSDHPLFYMLTCTIIMALPFINFGEEHSGFRLALHIGRPSAHNTPSAKCPSFVDARSAPLEALSGLPEHLVACLYQVPQAK